MPAFGLCSWCHQFFLRVGIDADTTILNWQVVPSVLFLYLRLKICTVYFSDSQVGPRVIVKNTFERILIIFKTDCIWMALCNELGSNKSSFVGVKLQTSNVPTIFSCTVMNYFFIFHYMFFIYVVSFKFAISYLVHFSSLSPPDPVIVLGLPLAFWGYAGLYEHLEFVYLFCEALHILVEGINTVSCIWW